MKPKNISLIGKICAGTLLVVLSIVKGFFNFSLSISEIVLVSVSLAGIISGTIDLNIALDKFAKNVDNNNHK